MTDGISKVFRVPHARGTRSIPRNHPSSVTRHRHVLHTLLDFQARTLYHDIAARVVRATTLVAQFHKGTAYHDWAQLLGGVAADDLHGTCHGHELTRLVLVGFPEIDVHQFRLQPRRLELPVVAVQPLDLVL